MRILQMAWRNGFLLGAFLLANLLLIGCSSLTYTPQAETNAPGTAVPTSDPGEGVLVKGDLVKIDFSGTIGQMQSHEEHIRDDGTISPPLIGPVKAAGKSAGQLQQEIQNLYVPRYYKNLTVTVKAVDRFYYVGGEVKSPGRQLYLGPVTVTGAIKSAGDFTDFAKRTKVKIIRNNGTIQIVNCVKAQENPELDLPVYPGDRVDVPRGIL